MRDKFLVLLLALAVSPAWAKSLHWRALDVQANLDRDGSLHVVERQAMVFDGDWNGGERTFRTGPRQTLDLESVARVDDQGQHPLVQGDVDKVDHYAFASANVLRWRSRLPSDPPFENREITYVLRYTIHGVLRQTDGTYILNHDFAFPNRDGVIERFSLRFDLDPVWRGAQSPMVINQRNLVPGESVVVPLTLEFTGASAPQAVRTLSWMTVYAILAIFAVGIAFLLIDFFMSEQAKGRFTPIPRPNEVNDAFLAQNVFALKPEAVGAAIDTKVAAPEVAAVLARMTQEGKISSRIESRGWMFKHQVLCLTLNKAKHELSGYEAKLAGALFFNGDTTDTDAIRKHYSSVGFSPAGLIEGGIESELAQHVKGWEKTTVRANWKRDWMLIGLAFVLLIVAGVGAGGNTEPGIVIFMGMISVVCAIGAAIAAMANSSSLTNFPLRFLVPAIFLAPLYWMAIHYTLASARLVLHLLTPVALCAWTAAITKLTVDLLRSPESAERIAFRKKLFAARNWFIAELRSRQPRLRDDWYPYLLALGLGTNVERWFGSHGDHAVSERSTSSSFGSSSGSGSAPAFTGGGGAFGGAGATGGWAIAAAAMAAGVSAPSSSSGSSGGGSSSSSGGGGGGGW